MERPALFQMNQNLSALEKTLLEREKEILNQDKNAKFFDWEKIAEGIPMDDEIVDATKNKSEVLPKKTENPILIKAAENNKENSPSPKEASTEKPESDGGEDDIGADSSDDDESIVSDADQGEDDGEIKFKVGQLKAKADEHTKNCRWKEAIELYTEALKYRKMATLYGNRSLCYQKVEDFEKSEKDCGLALELDWKYKKMYKRRAALRLRLRNYYGCAADLQNVIILSARDSAKDPLVAEQYQALVQLARLDQTLSGGGAVAESTDPNVRRLEEQTLARISELNEAMAVNLLNRGEAQDAIDYLLMAMMATPDSARLYGHRASANVKRGNLSLAEADLTTAIRLDPSNSRYLRLRAELRRKRDDKAGAAEDEQAAKKLSRSGVTVSNTAKLGQTKNEASTPSTQNVATPLTSAKSTTKESSQWTHDSLVGRLQKSTAKPAQKSTARQALNATTSDDVDAACTEPLSKMIRLSVEDVYSSSAGELLNLSKLPLNIRRMLT